jgi:hypothetical protein
MLDRTAAGFTRRRLSRCWVQKAANPGTRPDVDPNSLVGLEELVAVSRPEVTTGMAIEIVLDALVAQERAGPYRSCVRSTGL